MDLRILDLREATRFEPQVPTYAIRIFHTWDSYSEKQRPLNNSPNYREIKVYRFDDLRPEIKGDPDEVPITEETAQKILQDFQQGRIGCESLMVHCSLGRNRGPAVAIALNDVFDLGQDTEGLKQKYKEANWYVYEKILESSRKLNL